MTDLLIRYILMRLPLQWFNDFHRTRHNRIIFILQIQKRILVKFSTRTITFIRYNRKYIIYQFCVHGHHW